MLKVKMNSSYSSFANTLTSNTFGTNVMTNDYANAIVHALRFLGKECPIWKKSILIPLEYNKRYYATYINLYTKELIDLVKPTQLAYVGYNTANEIVVGELNNVTYESIERNQYIDALYFGQKLYGDHFALKSSSLFTGVTGSLNYVKTAPTTTVLPVNTSITSGQMIYNLEYAEKLIDWYTQATSTGTSPNTLNNTFTYGWLKDDVLWQSTGNTSFMLFTFTAIPQLTHFKITADTTGTTPTPIMNQFLDDIDDICQNYLYKILMQRNPELVNVYAGMLKTGLIRTDKQVLADVMGRASTIESTVVNSYNYKGQRYGR